MAMKKCLIFFMILSMLFVQMPVWAFAADADLMVAAGNGMNGEKGHDQTLKAENGGNGEAGGNGKKREFPITGSAARTAWTAPRVPIR